MVFSHNPLSFIIAKLFANCSEQSAVTPKYLLLRLLFSEVSSKSTSGSTGGAL